MVVTHELKNPASSTSVSGMWTEHVGDAASNPMLLGRRNLSEQPNYNKSITGVPPTRMKCGGSLHGLNKQLPEDAGIYKS